MFVIGNSSSPSFSTIDDKEREEFITNTADALKLSKERTGLITDYMADVILEDIGEKRVPIVDIIKKIVNSDFTDIEKDYVIFILGLVSLFTDFSSEMIYPLLPVFLTATLGAGPAALGIIEGVAETTASLLKLVSGIWSDRTGRKKPLVLSGYGISAAMRPRWSRRRRSRVTACIWAPHFS